MHPTTTSRTYFELRIQDFLFFLCMVAMVAIVRQSITNNITVVKEPHLALLQAGLILKKKGVQAACSFFYMGSNMSSEICALSNAVLEPDFCAYELPVRVDKPRSVVAIGASDFLILERGSPSVVKVYDSDNDGIPESRETLVYTPYFSLNHGLALHDGYIYASSDTTVFRWSYEKLTYSSIGAQETVIININAGEYCNQLFVLVLWQ